MFSVLIADDEEVIRKGIASLLQKDPELMVVASAEDGREALALAQEFRPDLMIVDINMPFLNGMEMMEKVREILPDTVLMVVTGYDDFTYLQRSLRLGVYDYVLKPIMEDTFFEAICRLKNKMREVSSGARYFKWAQAQLKKNRAALIGSFLSDWFEGRFSDLEALESLKYLEMEIPQSFGITVARIVADVARMEAGREWDENLLYYAAENIAAEIMDPFAPVFSGRNANGDLIVVSSSQPQGAFRQASLDLKEALNHHLPVQAVLAQAAGQGLDTVCTAYEEAMNQVKLLFKCPQVVGDALKWMQEHYMDPDLSLQAVAEQMHVSPQHLSRLFRHEMGITFVDLLTRIRIRRAVELLSDADRKVYEVAQHTGYASQHYFSSAFKKMLGVSPQEYRKNIQRA